MISFSLKTRLCLLWCMTVLMFPQLSFSADAVLVSSVAEENRDGPDAELLKAIADKLNAELKFIPAPFKRRLQLMKDGDIDFISGLLKTAEREKYIYYVYPPYKERSDTVFFLPKGKQAFLQKYEDLYAMKIGTNLGSKYFPQFDHDTKLNKEAVSSGVPNFRKLLLGRIDTLIYAEAGGIDLVHKMGIADRVVMAEYRFSRQKNVHIGLSRKSHLMDHMLKVDSLIGSMIESGEIKRIFVNYYVSHNLPVPAM